MKYHENNICSWKAKRANPRSLKVRIPRAESPCTQAQLVWVKAVLTHEQYDKGDWK